MVAGSKQRVVGIAVLCALAGLPVTATVCGMVCGAAEGATTLAGAGGAESVHQHHHDATRTDQQASSATGSQLASSGAHDCGAPDDAVPQSETATMAWREDVSARTLLLSAGPVLMLSGFGLVTSRHALEGQRPPEAASSPASQILVLRV